MLISVYLRDYLQENSNKIFSDMHLSSFWGDVAQMVLSHNPSKCSTTAALRHLLPTWVSFLNNCAGMNGRSICRTTVAQQAVHAVISC